MDGSPGNKRVGHGLSFFVVSLLLFLAVPVFHAICSIWELEPSISHAAYNILELIL